MSGFANVAAWAAAVDAGKTHVSTFRKTVASAATVANDFIDYTYFAGNPPANFYASSPLEAAYIESIRGIHVPTMTGTDKQFLKSITGMSAASSATGTSNQNQRHMLADYLLYYPFWDTDAVGELQESIPTVAIPRYASGQVICVAQSASSAVGTFTMSYTNQDGVAGRTSQTTYTKVVAGGGTLVSSATNAVAGSLPVVGLQAGDSGVQSIESVTFTAAGGGLMALVIVKPLFDWYTTQECRRTTTGNLDSFGAGTVSATAQSGYNIAAALTGAGGITGSAGLIVSIAATLIASGGISSAQVDALASMVATITGSGDVTATAAGLADLGAVLTGTGTVDASNTALMDIVATIRGYGDLTPEGLRDAVWDASLANYPTAGSAGLALATASSGGVDYNALALAVWEYATRTLTSGAPPTAEQIATAILAAAQLAPIHANTQLMNDADVIGTGEVGDAWRGVGVPP